MSHFTRRHFLAQQSLAVSSLALAWLQQQELKAEPPKPMLEPQSFDNTPKVPSAKPQATALISMFMQGGPSHIDLFDPKPELNRLHMKTYTGDIKYDNAGEASSKLFGCPWRFRKYGQCGMDLSELVSNLGSVADDICLIRSMHTGVNNHGESINALNVALQKFEGTVFLVTHDQDLIEEVASRLWVFTETGIQDFKGTYEEFSGETR